MVSLRLIEATWSCLTCLMDPYPSSKVRIGPGLALSPGPFHFLLGFHQADGLALLSFLV